MTAILRLAPSGPPLVNANGGVLGFGPGARLRLVESNSIMGGSLAVPTVPDVIAPGGFGTAALVLSLPAPSPGLQYRAKMHLDCANSSTNVDAEVVLYLDTSVDGGVTFTNAVRVAHYIAAAGAAADNIVQSARHMEINLDLFPGTGAGVIAGTASLQLRARANLPLGTLGSVQVSSLSASGGTSVIGLAGSIHMELEECF